MHGKNLFYFFGPEGGEQTVMHVRRLCHARAAVPLSTVSDLHLGSVRDAHCCFQPRMR